MPNPFGLFQKTAPITSNNSTIPTEEKINTDDFIGAVADKNKKTIKEGYGGAVSNTPDTSSDRMNFNGILFAAFLILAVAMGVLYYFNSSFLILDNLMKKSNVNEYYKSTDFYDLFGGTINSNYIVIFIVLWLIVFSINILICQVTVNIADISQIMYVTSIYYFGIVGSTLAIINNVPSLIEVFENTIGFGILPFISNMKEVTTIFKNRLFENSKPDVKQMGIQMNQDFLLTTFTLPSFHEHFDELFQAKDSSPDTIFYIDTNENDKNGSETTKYRYNLLAQVLYKHTIGHYMWILISSYLSILLAANSFPL